MMKRVGVMSYVVLLSCGLALGGCMAFDDPDWSPRIGSDTHALDTYTISGTVYGGGTPLANVVVNAMTDGTTTVVATATTAADGTYSVSVSSGTYDLSIQPASGSDFGSDVVQNVDVTDGDINQDIILITESSSTLSGTLYGHGGQAVANATVEIYNGAFTVNARTDANGQYTIALEAGSYRVRFRNGSPYSPHAPPGYYYCQRNQVNVSGETELNYTLPFHRLSGTVRGEGSSTPLVNTRIYSYHSSNINGDYCYTSHTIYTNSNGQYSGFVFSSNSRIDVSPPSGTSYGSVRETVSVNSDLVKDWVLPLRTTVSGLVTGHNDHPIANARVRLEGNGANLYTQTDAQGKYTAEVSPGSYRLYVQHQNPSSPYAPQGYYYCRKSNLAISGATTVDFSLPIIRMSGNVVDATDNSRIPNTRIEMYHSSTVASNVYCYTNHSTTTTSTGSYQLFGFKGSSQVRVYPNASSSYGPDTFSVNTTADVQQDFALSAGTLIEGTLTGYNDNPISGYRVYVSRGGLSLQAQTDANGHYSLLVSPGSYRVQFQRYQTDADAPSTYHYCRKDNLAVQQDTVELNYALPVARISGHVTDFNGAPVPGTTVDLGYQSFAPVSGEYCYISNMSRTTDSNGNYAMLAFTGKRDIAIRPPVSSGFTPVTLDNVLVASDLHQNIKLQRPDTTPPVIVSGPSVIHLSDDSVSINWVTNEPADSNAAFGVGGLTDTISHSTLTTNHSVTLLNLTPSTVYQYQVSSSDAEGNGPTSSATVTFLTAEPPGDITSPLITDGPNVTFIDQERAIIQWTTDEPASSKVEYGLTDSLGQSVESAFGVFTGSHIMTLSGLSPSTLYHARVLSSDPDSNGPSISEIITFTTTDTPDTNAPVITAGPTIAGVTDTTITVTWETDEPATSGVSYTDGSVFNLVSDTTLTTAHSITLANLTPSTAYSITVSSRDAVDNGPTLGGPVNATTLATPDTTPPAITDIEVAAMETSAVISWLTDEPADSAITYSVQGSSSSNQVGAVALELVHSLQLQGLTAGTTYEFTVSSSDGSGNSASSSVLTFRTDDANLPPVANAGADQVIDCIATGTTADVALDGTGSSDPEGGTLTYSWSEAGTLLASGASPTISLAIGVHDISLIVNDGNLDSNVDTVLITVTEECGSTDMCTAGDELTGTDANDALSGGEGSDIIHGGLGNDHLHGGACHDSLFGGDGNDELDGEDGDDFMDGGAGDDELDGENGDDVMYGGDGDDELDGDAGDDTMYGGAGDDELDGDDGTDELHGGDGADNLDGDAGNDVVYGDAGNDWMHGASGDDRLYGGADDDALIGDTGNDILDGGDGNDRVYYSGPADEYVIIDNGDGSYRIIDSVPNRDGVDTLLNIEEIRFDSSIPWT